MATIAPNQPSEPTRMSSTSAQKRKADLQIHSLTSTATPEQVREIMALSAEIFAHVPGDPNTHTSYDFWRLRLSGPKSVIMYATHPSSEEPLGFFFSFPRTHKEFGFETLHVWLAGVKEEARGLGVFVALMEKTVQFARDNGVEVLSIGTLPKVFPRMWDVLQRNGWVLVGERGSDESVLMSLNVNNVK